MNLPLWDIEYSLEARNYLYDSYPYTENILIAIEELRFTPDATPPEGCIEIEPGIYMCEMLHHMVVYQKILGTQPKPLLWIGIVKPLE